MFQRLDIANTFTEISDLFPHSKEEPDTIKILSTLRNCHSLKLEPPLAHFEQRNDEDDKYCMTLWRTSFAGQEAE